MAIPKQKIERTRAPGQFDLRGAVAPANGFGAPSLNVRTAIVAVEDTDQDLSKPQRERRQVLARLDLLRTELQHGDITEEAFAVGRKLEAIFERTESRPKSVNLNAGSRGDPAETRMVAIARGVVNAKEIFYPDDPAGASGLVVDLHRAGLGGRQIKLILRILRDRMTYAQVAAAEQREAGARRARGVIRSGAARREHGRRGPSDRHIWAVAHEFRRALEDLADDQSQTTGPDRGRYRTWAAPAEPKL